MIETVLVFHPDWARHAADLLRRREPALAVRAVSTAPELEAQIADADALLTSQNLPLDPLARAVRLRWVQLAAAGADRIVRAPHLPRRVRITRLVGTFGPRMAEYAFAYALALVQDVPRVLRQQAERRWEPFGPRWLLGRTLLLVGVGEIGRAAGRLGRAFGMRVLGVARRARRQPGVDAVLPVERLREALAEADLVIVTVPATPASRGLFGPDEFAAMRDDAVFVNMGRGAVVQEPALVDGLRRGRPRWAVLDVFEQEPLPVDSPLWGLPNVIVTPHLAGPTLPEEAVDAFCENLARLRAGRRLRHVVHRARGY
ncbi:MAG: D-2-hydroxyacid dehydrogenase [Armatimonadota bacterium]|nr:D-2-hydroxyacid dehydrogenase [Armatimonadota bacterium]MDR7423109.1 D-2-hydroxyacid dehydrogenase [Armatimonadota bacterium]MDR7454644.1 D-2-hydroxyacid dehydrogenase [Armatimonadota bacterium]MDR7457900.1 D-2-hydroxyacid dehydrogenase [Armatimonadota bacterium]MDR7497559.1 D-2-hydroxyacid dehydrogenase [Armatimonadota bacterium]